MLELVNITKAYKTGDMYQKALNGVSVAFRDCEFVSVLGPSGSGKTTLLNVVGGLAHYDDGDLIINGISTKKFKDKDWDAYRNHEVGFVFQNYNLIQHQTILSNVELALTLSGVNKSERKKRAKEALCKVGLEDHIKKYPNQLSGGQMQRVAIARALVNDPEIIFADEPTGALDTKTSVQIMEILKKISKNKLVVMVTHNPELAERYSTRIVNLVDGKIVDDSQPFDPNEEACKLTLGEKFKKTSMSFLTALSLSFANLMGKKGRTIMTAFAGSIGIIGIAAILALSNGTRMYIADVQTSALSQYPLTITRSQSMLSALSDSMKGGNSSSSANKNGSEDSGSSSGVSVRGSLSALLSTSGVNDLKAFKSFLDTNPDDIDSYATSIEYSYDTSPVFYSNNQGNVREVYPNNALTSGSSVSKFSTSKTRMATTSYMSSGFSVMPSEGSLYKNSYSVAAGKWPESPNECVLVLNQDGTMSDSLLYMLGLRDYNELSTALEAYAKNEKTNLPKAYDDVPYDKILGIKFKVINPADMYTLESSTGVWVDRSPDTEFMSNLVNGAPDMTIVGIINSPQGKNVAQALKPGINYTNDLCQKCIDASAQSGVVQAQLANPQVDVLSGKTFEEERKSSASGLGSLDLSSLVGIDENALTSLLQSTKDSARSFSVPDLSISQEQISGIITSALNEQVVADICKEIVKNEALDADLQKIVSSAVNKYVEYAKTHPEVTPEQYFSKGQEGYAYIEAACAAAGKDLTPVVVANIAQVTQNVATQIMVVFESAINQAVNNLMANLSQSSGMESLISGNLDKIGDLLKINISPEKILQVSQAIGGATSRSYESNLSNFGYADLSNPVEITIYPKDFVAKDQITSIIDGYNNQQEESGNVEKVISYTDYAKVLMQSVNQMIDMVTAVLVAFVAISLLVSSIMIGIITYISVLERRKEIGILRAIGARKKDIFNVFNAETFIVGLVAGVIGILVTLLGCIPANLIARSVYNLSYDIAILPVWAAVALIIISMALTLIAGLIPSVSASKKDPVEAINS